jgi:hypothetical protein
MRTKKMRTKKTRLLINTAVTEATCKFSAQLLKNASRRVSRASTHTVVKKSHWEVVGNLR